MEFFDFFKKEKTPKMDIDELKETIDDVLIKGYRNIGQLGKPSPISNMSDEQILNINNEIMGIFREASSERNETIKATSLFAIVFHFLVIYATNSQKFYYEHIDYDMPKLPRQWRPWSRTCIFRLF